VHVEADLPAIAELRPLSPRRWPNTGRARFDLTADGAGSAWQALAAGTAAAPGGTTLALTTNGEAQGWAGDGVRLDALHWSVRLPGPVDAPMTAELTVQDARWGEAGVTRASARLAGTAADHTLHVQALAPVSPPDGIAGLAGLGGSAATRLEATLEGHWRRAAPGTPEWQGRLSGLEMQAVPASAGGARSGTGAAGASAVAAASPSGSAASSAGQAASGAWLTVQPLDFSLSRDAAGHWRTLRASAGAAQVAGLALTWQPSFWTLPAADGEPARWSFDAALASVQVAPLLARAQPAMGWHGDLALGARLHAAFDGQWHVQAELARSGGDLAAASDVALPGAAPLSLGLGALYARLNAQDGHWNMDVVAAGDRLGELVAHARVTAPSPATLPDGASPLEADLRARVADLNVWGAWLPPGWRLGGRMRTEFTAAGRLASPRLSGDVVAHQLALRNALQGVYAHDGEVDIRLDGDRASIRTFRLAGGSGTLTADGDATLGASPVAHVHLEARQFQALGRLDRRLVASGDVRATLTGDALQVQGRLGIDEGMIDIGKGDAPTLDADVDVAGPASAAAPGSRPASGSSAAPPSKAARATTLDLALDLGDKLHLKGRGIDTYLRGALQISAPGGQPAVRGTIHTRGGHYTAYGQNLDVTRGDVFFTGPADDPRLDILATRPNLDVVVGVAITGTAQSPHVRLVSQPEMADTEKLSWLMLGRAPEGLGQDDTALLQQAAIALLAGEHEAPSDQLVRRLGLTDFSFRQQEDENNVRQTVVSLGRQLSRRWYLGYERGVNETTGNWQLIYRIAQRLTVRAQSGLDNSLDVIYTWKWN
jgi:translocation and assembly module TamB